MNIPPSVLVLNFSQRRSGMLFFPGWQKHFVVEENQNEWEIFLGSYPPENYEHLNGVFHSFHEFLFKKMRMTWDQISIIFQMVSVQLKCQWYSSPFIKKTWMRQMILKLRNGTISEVISIPTKLKSFQLLKAGGWGGGWWSIFLFFKSSNVCPGCQVLIWPETFVFLEH